MSQISKTLIFVGLAAVVVLGVFFTRPAAMKPEAASVVGDELIGKFDPLAVADMEIVDYNEATGELQPFEVKQVEQKGKIRWSIPSHNNYPADAKDQVAQAATSLLGLAILGVKGDSRDDHETFGVLDAKDAKAGSRGIGMKVTLRDKKGKDLVALIVGKEVPDRKGQRYVRLTGQNPVYIVEMKTDYLSTRFDRWIEKSLLSINTWDISKLWIRDHYVDENMALHERGEMVLEYNDKGEPHWKMLEDRRQDEATGKWTPITMADDETLNASRLDELKSALGELQIVDVERKPEGLSADLKASEDFVKSQQSAQALVNRGFFLSKLGSGYELFSNNGEIRCTLNDGVEYILRFGDIAFGSSAAGAAGEKAKEAKAGAEKKEEKGPGVNRYLFVMARFNQAGIPKPEEQPLPGDKPAAGTAPPAQEAKPADNPPADKAEPAPAETKPAPEANPTPPDEKKPAEETKPVPQEEKKPVEAKPTSYAGQEPTEDKPADAKPAESKPAADKPAEVKPADAQKVPAADEKPADTQNAPAANEKPAEGQPAATEPPGENPVALPTDPKALEAEREKVEKENQRKREEYEDKVKAGKKKVEELNARFADWFYIISDETYQKIHLTRENLIVKKTEKKEEKPGEPGTPAPGAVDLPPGIPAPGGK
ncbi:MAG: DUF4340 domain-containing protein [Pirellulales bacterium]|nr:DUF4340 domain-containing protein [Pirellulales bacterium]